MDNATKKNLYKPIGTSGLEQSSGYIREEFLRELSGTQWFKTVRRMADNSSAVGAVLYVIEMLIKQVKWGVAPADNSTKAKEIAEFVDGCFGDMELSWHETLNEAISFLPYGWCLMETTYKRRKGDDKNLLLSSTHNDGRVGWAEWGIRGQESLLHWKFDERGTAVGMVQQAPPYYRTVTIPLEKAILFRNGGRKQNPEGKSILRTAYTAWYGMTNIERIEGIGVERDLAGLPVAYIPSDVGADVESEWRNIITNIRNNEQAGVVTFSDRDENGNRYYELELLSSGGQRQFDTNAIINRYERQITQAVLANFIVTGMQQHHGSFSLHSSQTDLFATALKGHLENITSTINRHAIPKLVRLNGWSVELAPKLTYGDIETLDLSALGTYVKELTGAGVIFDEEQTNWLLEQAGIPTPQDGM